MTTTLIYYKEYAKSLKPVQIHLLLQEKELAIQIKREPLPATWKYAGTLTRFIGHPSTPTFLESWTIGFQRQAIQIPYLNRPYMLAFSPATWLGNYSLYLFRSHMPLFGDSTNADIAGNATQTVVAAATTSTVLLTANSLRKLFTIHNNSNSILYIGLGEVPTSTDFSFRIPANTFFEAPIGFQGAVNGIWASTNGNAQVTEFT
jgi:hypothetical protein